MSEAEQLKRCMTCGEPYIEALHFCQEPEVPQERAGVDSRRFRPGTGTDSQPMPNQGGGEPVTPVARSLFAEMLDQREQKGIETYGRSLHTRNGRDSIQDALEEVIDAWQYVVQILMERDALERALAAARADLASLERRRARLYKRLKHDAELQHRALPTTHTGPFEKCRFVGCAEARWSLRMGGPIRG